MFLQSNTDTTLAVFAIVTSVAALSLGDAVIKATGLALPLWQMFVLRSALTVPVLWWLVRRRAQTHVSGLGWVLLRCMLLVAMWVSYYSALPVMPLSLAAAAYYTGPLMIVALSAVVAQRWPGIRVMLAIVCGFVGVVLIIRPDMSGFAVGAILPIAAAGFYACAMVLTSAKCRDADPFVLALALNIAFVVTGLGLGVISGREGSFILGPWQPIDMVLGATVVLLAGLILTGSVGAAIAYQKGPPATVAAFDYSYLVFSLIWGAVFFAEWPDRIAFIGIVIIMIAGLCALPRRTDPTSLDAP